jgi:hypothetical protein
LHLIEKKVAILATFFLNFRINKKKVMIKLILLFLLPLFVLFFVVFKEKQAIFCIRNKAQKTCKKASKTHQADSIPLVRHNNFSLTI